MSELAWLLPWLITAHVVAAVIGIGPAFGFGVIGRMGRAERGHAEFAGQVTRAIQRQNYDPALVVLPVTGLAIIWISGIDLLRATWLLVSIAIYAGIVAFGLTRGRADRRRLGELGAAMRSSDGRPDPSLAAEMNSVARRVKFSGRTVSVGFVVILALMVMKPGL